MRRRKYRWRKILLWGFLFVASVLVGAIAFAYTYITDSETLAALIRDEAPRYLPDSRVNIERVLLRPLVGDVELRQTTVWQKIDGQDFLAAKIAWLQIRSDFKSLLWGKPAIREVIVAHPQLRIKRRKDGSWNLQGLLADPFPQTNLPKPVVTISGGTIELDDGPKPGPILRDVSVRVEPLPDGSYHFEGDARGVAFERLALAGTYDPRAGVLVLTKGDLSGLTLSDALRSRLPKAAKDSLEKLGLDQGEVDISVARLVRDPKANPPLTYEVGVVLREGVWRCPDMPFPLAGVAMAATITPATIRIDHASGHDGKTEVRLRPSCLSAVDPAHGPMDLDLQVEHLDLDERLKAKTPVRLFDLWEKFSPPDRKNLGQVNASVRVTRARTGEDLRYVTDVDVQDVAIQHYLFKYPLEHVHGKLTYKDRKIAVNLRTFVAGQPLTGIGTIENPGPNAVVYLTFKAGAMPVDSVLLNALPPEASQVVKSFQPKGSVRGTTVLTRTPVPGDTKGKVRVDSDLYLNDGCSIAWKGLPYPVRDLTGHLSLHPDRWVFTDMKGRNNSAEIAASGKVLQISPGKLAVDLHLQAEKLPFDSQLRDSLPVEWSRSWGVLNPLGSARVDAHIVLAPDRPGDYKFTITPEPNTRVQLRLTPAPGTEISTKEGVIALPSMDGVSGKFLFDNGVVTMNDVAFTFRQAPVHFGSGQVRLQNNGAFTLSVNDLEVKGLRMEHELRKIMPPVMSQFAYRLNDGMFSGFGNMTIGWTGVLNDAAVCSWDHARVVFNDNHIATGLPIEHIQGQISDISGKFDGRKLTVDGIVDLESVKIQDQHLTKVSSPLHVGEGRAALTDLAADLLGGKLYGKAEVTLDATPHYTASFKVVEAKLEEYAKTIEGHQEYAGTLNASVEVEGLGQDLKTLHGKGNAQVIDGDFGKLPLFLKLIEGLPLKRRRHMGFDAANVSFTMDNGQANLDPITITSDSINLHGSGTVSHLGSLNLQFTPTFGRDERSLIRAANSAIRPVEGQLMVIHVGGNTSLPKIQPTFLPFVTHGVGEVFRKISDRRGKRDERR